MTPRTEIYINDEACDLEPDTVIALTLQAFEPGKFSNRFASFTNRFKLPLTPANALIFGHAKNINSSSRVQFVSNRVRVTQNGVEIVRNGYLVHSETSDGYKVSIFSGLLGLTDTIGEKMLYELSWGVVSAALLPAPTMNDSINDTYHNEPLPCFDYPDLIEAVLSEAGYSFDGDIFSSLDYDRMFIPWARDAFEYGPEFTKAKEFKASAINKVITPSGSYQNVTNYDSIPVNGSDNFFNPVTGVYTVVHQHIDGANYFEHDLFADLLISSSSGGIVEVAITINGGQHPDATSFFLISPSLTNERVSLIITDGIGASGSPPGTAGVTYSVAVRTNLGTPGDLTIHSIVFYNKVSPLLQALPDYPFLLPDIEQIELLNDFLLRFGLVPRESEGAITFKNVDSIISDFENAVDWSSKRVPDEADGIEYIFDEYARINNFKYSSNDDIVNEEEGNFSTEIDNINLKEQVDLISSIVNNTATALIDFSGTGDYINMAHIPIFVGSDFNNDPGFRVLMLRDRYTNEAGSGKVAYFIEPREPYQMSWQYFFDTYYAKFFAALQDIKYVTRMYLLTEVDIAEFDPTRLIFDDGDYFAFPKVSNFVPGRPTKVSMLKIG